MNIKDVDSLAELARIELNNDEKEQILKDMGGILAYVGQIESLQVEIEPKHQIKNIWREDTTEEKDFSRDLIIDQFPDKQDDFLKVKKIL